MAYNLDYFLHPKSIAIVGASAIPNAVGYNFIANLVDLNFSGKIFPVNPNIEEILDIKVYPDIKSIPEQADLAMIAIQPSRIPNIVRECGENGVKAIIIAAAGFSDIGKQGQKLERKVVDLAHEYGIMVIGPNTQGFININKKSAVLSIPLRLKLHSGKGVSYICQTGFFYWDWISRSSHIGLSKAIDLGNMSDVNHAQVLEYLGNDPDTRVVALHIEGISDGLQFIRIAGKVTKEKPVIALKAGRTEKGAKAIASHTGSMAGDATIYDAAFRQAGIIRAVDMDELVDFTKVLACLSSLPTGKRIAVVTFTGAGGSLAADACDEFGMELSALSNFSIETMQKVFPAWATIGNPLDVLQVIKTEEIQIVYAYALEALSADPNVDAIVVITLMGNILAEFDILDVLMEHSNKGPRKPTVVVPLRFHDGFERATRLDLNGLPVFPTVRRGVKALATAYARYQYLHR